jgi:hypothetical protein
MCDYSLKHVASRPAVVEDVLTTSNFIGTISRGFTPEGEPNVACCILPGTEIAFTEPVKVYETPYSSVLRQTDQTLARFRQIDVDKPHVHHDALEFANGEVILLNNLVEGQKATVLQLPAAPKTADEAKAQGRLEVVA